MESAGGLVPQLIAAGVGGGIVALIGLIGVLIRIFVRLGRLEKAVEGLEAGLRTTQDDVKGLRHELNEFRQGVQDEFKEVRREFQDGFNMLRREFRENLQRTEDRLRQEFREEIRNTEERLRDLIRAESEATREATRNEIRRLTDALVSHSHEPDGSIRFVMPPQYPGQGADGAGE